jgi:putative protease
MLPLKRPERKERATMRPELLVPAGNLEKLETALDFGADAVYVGGQRFGLRALAANFSLEDLSRARALTRSRNKRLYLTLNASLRPEETADFCGYLEELRPLDIDAYIVSDPGALALLRKVDPRRKAHLSTQANTTNAAAADFWGRVGICRVNLARELTLEQIRAIRAETGLELEVFVHGAMCMAVSGRCLLSAALTGRSANRGECAHPCRWRYALMEETRPGDYLPVEEDERGAYLLNSRDLCLIEELPRLIGAGIDSFKIEGRMKSRYYVAAVTRVYRAALDAYLSDPEGYCFDDAWRQELTKVSHRPYDRGFLDGPGDGRVHAADARYRSTCEFVGVVGPVDENGWGEVEGRNRFFPGETLELFGPQMRQVAFRVGPVRTAEGGALSVVQPNARVKMELPAGARLGDLLRREKESGES